MHSVLPQAKRDEDSLGNNSSFVNLVINGRGGGGKESSGESHAHDQRRQKILLAHNATMATFPRDRQEDSLAQEDPGSEPTEALDLRMSKMDECASMYGDKNVLLEPYAAQPSSSGYVRTSWTERREDRLLRDVEEERFSALAGRPYPDHRHKHPGFRLSHSGNFNNCSPVYPEQSSSSTAAVTSLPPLIERKVTTPPARRKETSSRFRSSLQSGASKPSSYWMNQFAEQDRKSISHSPEIAVTYQRLKEEQQGSPPHSSQAFRAAINQDPRPPPNFIRRQIEDNHDVRFDHLSSRRPLPLRSAPTYLQLRSSSPPPAVGHRRYHAVDDVSARDKFGRREYGLDRFPDQKTFHDPKTRGQWPHSLPPPPPPPPPSAQLERGHSGMIPVPTKPSQGKSRSRESLQEQLLERNRPPRQVSGYLYEQFRKQQQSLKVPPENTTSRNIQPGDKSPVLKDTASAAQEKLPDASLESREDEDQVESSTPSASSLSPPPPSTSTATSGEKGKRGRPRKHAVKIPLPPLYVFIRNLLHSRVYNPRVISWISESQGVFKVTDTQEFARTWGLMKSNRSEEMNYEKISRAMRYHYGNERQGRKGHLAMVKEKRLVYRFGVLAINWRKEEVKHVPCTIHELCKRSLCLWTKE